MLTYVGKVRVTRHSQLLNAALGKYARLILGAHLGGGRTVLGPPRVNEEGTLHPVPLCGPSPPPSTLLAPSFGEFSAHLPSTNDAQKGSENPKSGQA